METADAPPNTPAYEAKADAIYMLGLMLWEKEHSQVNCKICWQMFFYASKSKKKKSTWEKKWDSVKGEPLTLIISLFSFSSTWKKKKTMLNWWLL